MTKAKRARKSVPAEINLETADTKDLVLAMLRAKEVGKAGYAKADELLEKILQTSKVGDVIDIGGGQQAVIVDNFATKNKVWKPTGITRFDVKIERAANITSQL